jgi:hypothetical protein
VGFNTSNLFLQCTQEVVLSYAFNKKLNIYWDKKISRCVVVETPHVWGLFKNVQMQGAQKTEPRGVYRYTLSGAVCSATKQTIVPL